MSFFWDCFLCLELAPPWRIVLHKRQAAGDKFRFRICICGRGIYTHIQRRICIQAHTHKRAPDYEYKHSHKQAVNTPFVWRVSVLNLRSHWPWTYRSQFACKTDTRTPRHTHTSTHASVGSYKNNFNSVFFFCIAQRSLFLFLQFVGSAIHIYKHT